ncbi:hypothetical protein JM16_000603 [Phytophthora kernoviae]|nr:hypothetical protein JM16_000603 [Phytophthora kernoviae]
MKSYASATDLVRTYSEIPSVEEALVTLDRAAVALGARRYRDALKLYLEGGYAMANVAERQANPKICNLLTSKGFETLNWCARLCDWIEGRVKEKHPRPGVHKVGIPVSNWDEDWVGPYLDEEEARRMCVLPGAFSAYRYEAIRGAPLDAYFQTLNVDLDVLGPFIGNMYLAEDRILSFEVVARKGCSWTMHYVKDAVARTDVPHDLVGLISQRKRWLNGAFFATLFSIWNWGRIYSESSHSFVRKSAFLMFYVYHLLYTAFGYFLPANLYLALYFIVFQGFQQNRLNFVDTSGYSQTVLDCVVYIYNLVYLFGLLMLIIIGLGNNPKHMKLTYYFVGAVFGVMMMMSSLVGVGIFFSSPATVNSIVVSILTIGVYFIGSALHGEMHHIFMTFTHYTALIPSFVNIFTIYSFCNLQDLSWGTKGLHDDPLLIASLDETEKGDFKDVIAKRRALEERRREEKQRMDNRKKNFEAFRTNVLLTWAFSNLILALFIVYFADSSTYMPVLYIFVASINSCRLLGCIGHWVYIHTSGLRAGFLDKSECGNGTGRYPQNSYVQLDEHYAALAEDQRTYASGRTNTSVRTNDINSVV